MVPEQNVHNHKGRMDNQLVLIRKNCIVEIWRNTFCDYDCSVNCIQLINPRQIKPSVSGLSNSDFVFWHFVTTYTLFHYCCSIRLYVNLKPITVLQIADDRKPNFKTIGIIFYFDFCINIETGRCMIFYGHGLTPFCNTSFLSLRLCSLYSILDAPCGCFPYATATSISADGLYSGSHALHLHPATSNAGMGLRLEMLAGT